MFGAPNAADTPLPSATTQPLQTADCPLMRPITMAEVVVAFQHVGTAKAPGADALPAEFITKAFPSDSVDATLFADTFTAIFNQVVLTSHMPASWKVKCISPKHKAGDKTECGNYRPLAVATTPYRIFTAIFGKRLSAYVHGAQHGVSLHDSQFAFRKDKHASPIQSCMHTSQDCYLTHVHATNPLGT
jgi:hypothetical protein